MKASAILLATLAVVSRTIAAEQGATNTTGSLVPFRPLTDADWRFISATQSSKPLSALSITNRLSQDEILSISDPVSVRHGLVRYMDAMCSFGARLHRDYVGPDSVVRVSFLWDHSPEATRFSFYGTNSAVAASWHTEMFSALRDRLGQNVTVEVQPASPTNGRQPNRSATNSAPSAAGSRR